jgi:hypothetical protein
MTSRFCWLAFNFQAPSHPAPYTAAFLPNLYNFRQRFQITLPVSTWDYGLTRMPTTVDSVSRPREMWAMIDSGRRLYPLGGSAFVTCVACVFIRRSSRLFILDIQIPYTAMFFRLIPHGDFRRFDDKKTSRQHGFYELFSEKRTSDI